MGYLHQEVNRLVGQAIHRYGLLAEGDRILVAVSGGADSLLALWFIHHWLTKAPIHYTVLPVHLDMGFPKYDWTPVKAYLKAQGLSYHLEQTNFGFLAHSSYNRKKSPCFLCSMLRRKRLFEIAHHYSCNKIALGHNQDDVIETFFLNVCFSGEMSTMVPRQEVFKGQLALIRPLSLVEKSKIERLATELKLPVFENSCPSAGQTRRHEIKKLLAGLFRNNRKVRGNIMHAMANVRPEYLL